MTRARELANFADNTAGLETLTVSDITDLSVSASNINSATNQITDSSTDLNVDSNTLVVDKSENKIGIGTDSPGSYYYDKLTIDHTNSNSGITLKAGTTEISGIAFADGTTGNEQYRGRVLYYHNEDRLSLGSAGDTHLHIDSAGKVGIGTTSPNTGTRVHIKNTDDTRGLYIENTLSSSYAEAHFKASREFRIGTGNSTSDVNARDRFYIYDATATAHRFTLDSSGNVGIGTTGPQCKLNILPGNAVEGVRVSGSSNTLGLSLAYTDAGHTHSYIYNKYSGNDNSDIIFGFGSSYGSGTVMTLKKSGKIEVANQQINLLAHGLVNVGGGGNANFSFDIPMDLGNQVGGILFCHHYHYGLTDYGASLIASVGVGNAGYIERVAVDHTTTAGGYWSVSKVNSGTIRVTKNGGTYGGSGNYQIGFIGHR